VEFSCDTATYTSNNVIIAPNKHDANDEPIPIYQRGLWLDHSAELSATSAKFFHTFTIQLWASLDSDGVFYSINAGA
jgi:hypothetical protein